MHGCVQVYTGNGKGKTTAALGLLMRAVGAGLRVWYGQFLKSGNSSECRILKERFPEVECRYFGSGAWIKGKPSAAETAAAQAGFEELCEVVTCGNYDLAIADEINQAVSLGMIDVECVMALIESKPPSVELVLTGRSAHPRLMERADLTSEIVCRGHPFERGINARRGMEY